MARMRSRCSSTDISSAAASAAARFVEIVGIDDQRLGQLTGRARELAEHEHAALIVPGGDEFLGDEIHPIVQTADVADVGGAVVPEDRRRLVMGTAQNNRPVGAVAEPLIDPVQPAAPRSR